MNPPENSNSRIKTAGIFSYRLPVALLILFSLACSTQKQPDYWSRLLIRADRNGDQGNHLIARLQYNVLLPFAKTEKHRQHILYHQAKMLEQEGKLDRALIMYKSLWEPETPDGEDEYSGHALFRTGLLYYNMQSTRLDGLDIFDALIIRYPNHPTALKATRYIIADYIEQNDLQGGLEYLIGLYPVVKATDIGDNILYEVSRFYKDHLNKPDKAIHIYKTLLQEFPMSGFGDDAMWYIAVLSDQKGDFQTALTYYGQVTLLRGKGWWFGNYNSTYVDEAFIRKGEIYVAIGEKHKAIREYELFLEVFPDYLKADDVSWALVRLRADYGDPEDLEAAIDFLLTNYPESRFCAQARVLREQKE